MAGALRQCTGVYGVYGVRGPWGHIARCCSLLLTAADTSGQRSAERYRVTGYRLQLYRLRLQLARVRLNATTAVLHTATATQRAAATTEYGILPVRVQAWDTAYCLLNKLLPKFIGQ